MEALGSGLWDYGYVRSTVITVITELRSLKKIVIVQYDDVSVQWRVLLCSSSTQNKNEDDWSWFEIKEPVEFSHGSLVKNSGPSKRCGWRRAATGKKFKNLWDNSRINLGTEKAEKQVLILESMRREISLDDHWKNFGALLKPHMTSDLFDIDVALNADATKESKISWRIGSKKPSMRSRIRRV